MVFGNLSTGYWLGAAAAAGLHWIELGRTTLTGTSDDIYVDGLDLTTTENTPTVTDTLTSDLGWVANGTGNGYNASDYIDFKMVSPDASSGSDRDTVSLNKEFKKTGKKQLNMKDMLKLHGEI